MSGTAKTAFRKFLIHSPGVPAEARRALAESLDVSDPFHARRAREQAARIFLAETALADRDIAPLVDLEERRVQELRAQAA